MSEALAKVLENSRPLGAESAELLNCWGRTLAEPVVAVRTVPPHANSAMDGFAVRSTDGATLNVVGKIFAGERATRALGPGEAMRIFTGAAVPEGADAVVMQEHTTLDGARVTLTQPVRAGQNVRAAGEDARAGQPLLEMGAVLGVPELGLLWSQGLTHASVHRRPSVAIASTGNELSPIGMPPGERTVDSNSPSLGLLVQAAGGVPTLLGACADEPSAIERHFARGLDHDVLITSAGVSVGEHDYVKASLEKLGVRTVFWRTAIRPGKPVLFGVKDQTLVFGLPGNPVSSLVTFELFVKPALKRLQGQLHVEPLRIPAKLSRELKKPLELRTYFRVHVTRRDDGQLWAEPLPSQTSGALSSATTAWLAETKEGVERLCAGDGISLISTGWRQ